MQWLGFNPIAFLHATKHITAGEEILINYHEYGDRLYKNERYKVPTKLNKQPSKGN
jgi:hypothetical protein